MLAGVSAWAFASVVLRQRLFGSLSSGAEDPIAAPDLALLALYGIDFYLTVCVYAGLSRSLREASLSVRFFFRDGWHFLSRMLLYNLFVLCAGMVLITIPVFINDALVSSHPLVAGALVAVALTWVAVPLYVLFLTLLAPFIVLTTDGPLIPALRVSFLIMRRQLPGILFVLVCLGAPMAVAIMAERFYNVLTFAGLFLTALRTLALVYLEIAAAKAFLLFSVPERKETHEGTV